MAQRIFLLVTAIFLVAGVSLPVSVLTNIPDTGYSGSFSFEALAIRSQAAYDGWVLESSETGSSGGTWNSASTVFLLGDDAQDRQYRAILSFNTASLPDTAVITKVTLTIKRHSVVGDNPFSTHGRIIVDIREGFFSNNRTLQASDFQAAASRNTVGIIANTPEAGNWYSASLNSAAFPFVNLAGATQVRLRFASDDNDDRGADALKFFSGDAASAYRPQLAVEYYLPPPALNCPPLPPPSGSTVTVSTESALRHQASTAAPGTSILVAPGVYHLQDAVWVVNDGITIRGATGNREDVILDGGGMLAWTHTHVIAIDADDVIIADLTIRNGDEHGISVQGRDRPSLYNLHILNTGYQLVKVNPVGDGSDDGLLACSRLEYTTASPEEYTNGISAHNAHRWTVRDNEWRRIRTPGNTPAPTILFWSGSSDTVVERNLLVDCYQGIAFGNASHGPGDHTGGIVRNNFIYASQPHDSVIEMVHATGWLVANNTALLLDPNGLDWGMEARFSDTVGTFAYNLTNLRIWNNRDGARGAATGNLISAEAGWFVNPLAGDLHLLASATDAIDHAAPLPQVTDDYDAQPRPIGSAPDVGADEYNAAPDEAANSKGIEPLGLFYLDAVSFLFLCAWRQRPDGQFPPRHRSGAAGDSSRHSQAGAGNG